MATTRAKFRVEKVTEQHYSSKDGQPEKYCEEVRMFPVYSPDPESENRAFWEATPNGNLGLYINNKEAWGHFIEGQEYYVDFTPADQ